MSSTRGHYEGLFDALPVRPDRRAYTRSNSALLTYVELGDGNGGIALNVSEAGLAITAAELLMSDHFPSIRFQLPTSDVWIEASGQVAWVSASKKGAGIQFVDLADNEREKIREWIAAKDFALSQIQGTSETIRERDMEFLGIRSASKHPMKDRKLEVLSEADEAKFARMFPSEKSLANVHERERPTADTEPPMAGQNSRNVLRFSGKSLERGERSGAPESIEPTDDQLMQPGSAPAPAHDNHSVENKTLRPSDLTKENSIPAPRVDESCEGEQQPEGESEPEQPEGLKAELTRNSSDESKSLHPADSPKENPLVATETDESSEIGKGAAGGKEQEAPAYVFSRETDLIQQLELHRRNQAANLSLGREREALVERRSGWPLAALVLLIGITCFAVGVGVGDGFFGKLLGHDQPLEQRSDAKPANLPASTAGENDFAGGSAVAGNAQKSTGASSNDSADTVTGRSPAGSKANLPVQRSGADREAEPSPTEVTPDTDNADENDNSANSDVPDTPVAKRQQAATSAISPPAAPSIQTAEPFSEIQGPVLVTAPDENSGPFRLTLAEQAVSASPTLAISAQRSVSIPAQPGPSSAHRPERLQVGVLIYHADPQVPAVRDSKQMAGTVKVRATIGKGGNVVEVNPLSGPTPLIPAVVQAVREWRYTVTLLDGQPLGAEEDVVVEFRPKS
jgi:PilZ domain/Gram-negative bacterial TonB protein C-terminal